MAKPIRAGLVGCGSLAQRGILPHLTLTDAKEKVKLVAVADADSERAQATAARFDVPAHFASVEAMLNGSDLDLVLVATPIPYHYANAMAAIQAGKHVYVQKAMTTTVAEADALLAARDQAGVKLAAAPGYDLFPLTGKIRNLVAGGALGHIALAYTYTLGFGHEQESIRAGSGPLAAIDPSWYYRPGGGPLPDVTIYALQLATSVLGPVRRVTGLGNRIAPERVWRDKVIPVEIDDNNLILMEFATGTLGVAAGSNCQGSQRMPWGSLGLYGTAGVLEITEMDYASGYPLACEVHGGVWQDATGQSVRTFAAQLTDQPYLRGEHLSREEPHVYADIMDLVDAIHEDRAPGATGEQARHVVEIIEASLRALSTGCSQELKTSF
jgi:predicted dehydrogenase